MACSMSKVSRLLLPRFLHVSSSIRVIEDIVPHTEAERNKARIKVYEPDDTSLISGVPEEQLTTRTAMITRRSKNALQSGSNDSHSYRLDFPITERWENPLIGWGSTADPLSNVSLEFPSQESAADYCITQGWNYEIADKSPPRLRPKSYADNFHWSRRTRIGNK